MSRRPKLISIIISTYNRPQALAEVLSSLTRQRDRNFEVLVADDGSGPETGELMATLAGNYPVPLRHVWQEDQGFRAAAARNRAVVAGSGDYLLFLDGDCLVLSGFVAGHRHLAEPGRFVAGNRILLEAKLTAEILAGRTNPILWSAGDFLRARIRGEINRLLPLLRLPDLFLWRRLRPRRWKGAMTCNLGVWREDFLQVNGFDEAFVGWGHEDAEFVGRLINAGIFRKEGRFLGLPVMHLWHQHQDRSQEAENLRRLHAHLANRVTKAKNGIDVYL